MNGSALAQVYFSSHKWITLFEGLFSKKLSPLPSSKVCGRHWLLKQPPVVISAMLVVTGGLPFPGNLLSRQFQVMKTLISSAWSKVGLVLGMTGGSQVSPGLRLLSPRGDFRGAERSCCLHSLRAHTHKKRRDTDTLSESLQIPKHKKGRLYRSLVTYLDFC